MSPLLSLNVSNDGFAFNTATGESYILNCCARLILNRLRSGETQEQIVDALSREFGIAQSRVEHDVTDFLQQLHILGLSGGNA